MANLVPRKGKIAEPFGPSAPLWERVLGVIDRMVFAARALTDAEAAALDAAQKVLYVDDGANGRRPSSRFTYYLEMRSVVQDLQNSGAAVEVLQAALTDWIVLGFKSEVEQAIADVSRLSSRSSVVDAMSCRAQLDETMLLSAGDLSYAPTSFYPLSAADSATWTIVEVAFAELSECAAQTFPAAPVTFGSASAGKLRFAYAAIETLRPWPVMQLLSRDDWRLPDEEMVSGGDGVNGDIPAYVQTMYAASIVGFNATPRPRPRWPPGTSKLSFRDSRSRLSWFDPVASNGAGRTAVARPTVRPADAPLGAGNGGGVVVGRASLPAVAQVLPFSGAVLRTRDPELVQRFRVPLDRSEWLARLAIARAERPATGDEGRPAQEAPPAIDIAGGANIVGFGCIAVPSSPHPNEQYEW
ncbi:hypothetical protein CcI49_06310 [Frankia sp. CcI49]|uniref:hypothetical protein n=1 Tax=Frankia sp. CcI49 TaxID=1745382 RepID=UPI000977F6E3|nr:hypothetical protein [Frankia sp. CcI49]ONH61767.1 hypothetical protein CcI49_06310 [Frankia sp. CcI49]